MFTKLWSVFILAIIFLIVSPVHGSEQFLTSYNVNYDVGSDGVTTIEDSITFKNTTDKFYASKYTVSIGAMKISDIEALDSKGALPTNITKDGSKTKIEVSFTDQVVGIDKEYNWKLRYKSNDYAERQGKVWQVMVPKAPKLLDGDSYSLSLSVPVAFGDPTSIDPAPSKKVESGGKIRMYYDKSALDQRGILASFGSLQTMDFSIKYVIRNKGVLPIYGKLPLPMDTNYQQVLINDLNPKPENVIVDNDGNYIAWYKLDRDAVLNVEARGQVQLTLKGTPQVSRELSKYESNRLVKADQYWDVDNPIIKQKVADILKNSLDASVREKAKLINRFVVNDLSYDHSRVEKEDFSRLGALSALNNPDKALCGEYADLFVTLARSAGIPARRLEGFAYTSNREIRPLSLGRTLLHAWAEYYDPVKGWVMVDPTWESSNDGVDYFSNFDLNHFVLAIQGDSSVEPSASGEVSVNVSDANFVVVKKSSLELTAPEVILSGLPAKIVVRMSNMGNSVIGKGSIDLRTVGLGALETSKFDTEVVPPFGYFEGETRLSQLSFLAKTKGLIEASFSGSLIQKEVELKPFYEYQTIFILASGSFGLMAGVYIFSLYLHIRSQRGSQKSKKEKKDDPSVYQQAENT